eukprot:359412-Chlamydomonas_euryale.AAC.3
MVGWMGSGWQEHGRCMARSKCKAQERVHDTANMGRVLSVRLRHGHRGEMQSACMQHAFCRMRNLGMPLVMRNARMPPVASV